MSSVKQTRGGRIREGRDGGNTLMPSCTSVASRWNAQGIRADACGSKALKERAYVCCTAAYTRYSNSTFAWTSISSYSLPPTSPKPSQLVHTRVWNWAWRFSLKKRSEGEFCLQLMLLTHYLLTAYFCPCHHVICAFQTHSTLSSSTHYTLPKVVIQPGWWKEPLNDTWTLRFKSN